MTHPAEPETDRLQHSFSKCQHWSLIIFTLQLSFHRNRVFKCYKRFIHLTYAHSSNLCCKVVAVFPSLPSHLWDLWSSSWGARLRLQMKYLLVIDLLYMTHEAIRFTKDLWNSTFYYPFYLYWHMVYNHNIRPKLNAGDLWPSERPVFPQSSQSYKMKRCSYTVVDMLMYTGWHLVIIDILHKETLLLLFFYYYYYFVFAVGNTFSTPGSSLMHSQYKNNTLKGLIYCLLVWIRE